MTQTVYSHGADWVSPGMDYKVYRNLGYTFAIRYVVPSIPGKLVSMAEVAAAHAHGVDVAFVYETSGQTWRGGHQAGLVDGEIAHNMLQALGAPYSVACYHAVDSQAFMGDMPQVIAWLEGVITGMAQYRTGVYGEFDVVQWAGNTYPEVFRWQTRAWSAGRTSDRAHLLQLGAVNIGKINADLNVAYSPNIGQWYADPRKQPDNLNGDGMLNGFIPPAEKIGIPFRTGTYNTLALYCDTGLFENEPQQVRVAIHSAGKGYSQIEEVKLQTASPALVTFLDNDVNAISFARNTSFGAAEIGYTIY